MRKESILSKKNRIFNMLSKRYKNTMSEFQQYQFKTIDQPLTSDQRSEVNSWSRRTTATSTSATFVYHYGDYFPISAEKAMTEYFDAMLYVSNWGTRRLIFRFPADFVDEKMLKEYCAIGHEYAECYVRIHKMEDKTLWEFYVSQEEYDEWVEEDDYQLGDLSPLREQILNGDYRPLYLAWLRVAQEIQLIKEDEEEDWDMNSPPIPENLQDLNAPLQALIDYFWINEDWVTAAAAYSPEHSKTATDYKQAISKLPEEEKMDFLTRLAEGEARLDLKFKKRLEALYSSEPALQEPTITIQRILGLSEEKMEERMQEEKRWAQAVYEKRMQKIAEEENTFWKNVAIELEYKKGKAYARATEALKELKEMSFFFGKQDAFHQKLEEVFEKYGRSQALMRRLEEAGVV